MMEERDSERNLVDYGFDGLLHYARLLVEHGINVRSNDFQYQCVVFSVCAMHSKVI